MQDPRGSWSFGGPCRPGMRAALAILLAASLPLQHQSSNMLELDEESKLSFNPKP